MNKYRRFYGIGIFLLAVIVAGYGCYSMISPKISNYAQQNSLLKEKKDTLLAKQKEKQIVESKIKRIQDSILGSQKKIYTPVETGLVKDSLFFTLYTDVIEMIHSNSVKIKSINYSYNPEGDSFVEFGKDVYFVSDINLELVSNYTNLGKLIQAIYQYPYYIKISDLEVKPFNKDKKILLSQVKLRLYAHTSPQREDEIFPGSSAYGSSENTEEVTEETAEEEATEE